MQTLSKGQHTLQNVSWVAHDSIGYLFPSAITANLNNTTATGNWRQITHQTSATDEPVQKDVFTLWLDHGQKPAAANYAYIVVPGTTASALDQYSKKNGIVILANTAEIQAVQNKDLNISELVFYQPGTIKLNNNLSLTVNSPCLVMIKLKGNVIERIAVAEPTEKLRSLQLTVSVPLEAKGDGWQASWNKTRKLSVIEIDLPKEEYAGKSVVLDFTNKKLNPVLGSSIN